MNVKLPFDGSDKIRRFKFEKNISRWNLEHLAGYRVTRKKTVRNTRRAKPFEHFTRLCRTRPDVILLHYTVVNGNWPHARQKKLCPYLPDVDQISFFTSKLSRKFAIQ